MKSTQKTKFALDFRQKSWGPAIFEREEFAQNLEGRDHLVDRPSRVRGSFRPPCRIYGRTSGRTTKSNLKTVPDGHDVQEGGEAKEGG